MTTDRPSALAREIAEKYDAIYALRGFDAEAYDMLHRVIDAELAPLLEAVDELHAAEDALSESDALHADMPEMVEAYMTRKCPLVERLCGARGALRAAREACR